MSYLRMCDFCGKIVKEKNYAELFKLSPMHYKEEYYFDDKEFHICRECYNKYVVDNLYKL